MPEKLEFRYIKNNMIRPSLSMYSRLPYDLIDSQNFENFEKFMK